MVAKYVWWDDVQRRERSRVDLRLPKPLHDFLREVAKKNAVTVNDLVVGMLVCLADADGRRSLRIEVGPSVRVTDAGPGAVPGVVPVASPSRSARKRWRIPKVP
jgi:hypothetical protein